MDKFWRDELRKDPDTYAAKVWDKLNRHPNKKSKKGSQHKNYAQTSSGTWAWRNPIGEEHDKSSRVRLVRKAGVGILRAKLKNEARQIINDSINEE
jgi:hypothetical protein